jgi:hypothetical protein
MAAQVFVLKNILIDQKLNGMFFVIHKTHDTDSSRLYVKIFEHVLRISKRKPGRAYLSRQFLCLEFLVSGHHEQIELCLLTVAEKKILADHDTEYGIDLITGFHVIGALVISALIGNLQAVQIIIGSYFPGKTTCSVFRSAII